jgi:RNA-directed DNA polymerase
MVGQKVADRRVQALVEAFLEQGVMDGAREWTPEQGTPQGAVVSPLLSNIYLDPLDHLMAARGFETVRHADDFVVLCRRGRGLRTAAAMDGASWTDAAPDQDAAGRRT